MKRMIAFLTISIFAAAVMVVAAGESKPPLRPSQVLMQARAAWMAAMNKNLGDTKLPEGKGQKGQADTKADTDKNAGAKKFEAIAKDATAMAAEAQKTGNGLANPVAKEITLSLAALARELSTAASKKDGDLVKTKLGEIKAKCSECHAKIRDKK
jgi:cytochrome c556